MIQQLVTYVLSCHSFLIDYGCLYFGNFTKSHRYQAIYIVPKSGSGHTLSV